MEATGVYWKAPWAILEDDFECVLVNARHVKQVPGRKTDVSDAEWLCRLVEAGLLKASFVPQRPIRQLRNLTRCRKTQIQERADADASVCVPAAAPGTPGRERRPPAPLEFPLPRTATYENIVNSGSRRAKCLRQVRRAC